MYADYDESFPWAATMFASAIVATFAFGCATSDPTVITANRVTTNTVQVPVPVPCINAEDIPALPPTTVVDVKAATTDQLAAAAAADAEAFQKYSQAVSKLFAQCTGGRK